MKLLRFFGVFLIVVMLFIVPLYLICFQNEPILDWVARYSGPGNEDYAEYSALDSDGNIYVTGTSSFSSAPLDRDYATVKYDSNGNELWVRRYDGPLIDMSYDGANGIAVDSLGNVFVTGLSNGGYWWEGGTEADIVTIKYSSNGNEEWVRRYNGDLAQPGNDWGSDIAVDSYGNAYVTGSSKLGSTYDYITIKYDSDGNELWTARYHGGQYRSFILTYEKHGKIWVNVTASSFNDIVAIKYDSDGNEEWVTISGNPLGGFDEPKAMVADSAGNVYVAGRTNIKGRISYSDNDYITIKYNANGNEEWVRIYDGPKNDFDMLYDLAVDLYGNVFVTGITETNPTVQGFYDWATIKYDPNGNEEWVRHNNEEDLDGRANSIAVDSTGNVYVAGVRSLLLAPGQAEAFYHTKKYDTNGNELWTTDYSPGEDSSTEVTNITLDSARNVYVVGYSRIFENGEWSRDYVTLKYHQKRTLKEQIEDMKIYMEWLYSEGEITTGTYNGLTQKLDEALSQIDGNTRVACNKLNNFIDQVNSAINKDPNFTEEGQILIDAANALIKELCGT